MGAAREGTRDTRLVTEIPSRADETSVMVRPAVGSGNGSDAIAGGVSRLPDHDQG